MKNFNEGNDVIDWERLERAGVFPDKPLHDPDIAAAKTLKDLRALSNVAQALENLIAQCGALPGFGTLQRAAARELDAIQRLIRKKMHS